MKQNWWKWLGAALLIFSFVVGMMLPLQPGLISSQSDHASTSEAPFKISISGYNTHFNLTKSSLKVWLVNDTARKIKTCATVVNVIDDQHIVAEFPPVAPAKDPFFGLAVYSEVDGLLYKPQAIFTTDTAIGGVIQSCKPEVGILTEPKGYPFRYILYESIRNLFFHVPMWFTMIALLTWAVFNNFRFLFRSQTPSKNAIKEKDSVMGKMTYFNASAALKYDTMADQSIRAGLLFGTLGLLTGSLWARVTWGAWWIDDVKLNGTAITMLAYLAYLVLRSSIEDQQKRARIGAIYSIFAYVMMIALIGILPRMQGADSLHPGNGGNPAFGKYDLDSTMRPVFYSAVIGWATIGFWIYSIRYRIQTIKDNFENK